MTEYTIRPLQRSDREWVAHFLDDRWGTTQIVSRGKALYGHLLPGFIVERGSAAADEAEEAEEAADAEQAAVEAAEEPAEPQEVEYIGLITINVNIEANECEITTLDSLSEGSGIGSALVEAVENWAREYGIQRIWLITTNDNLAALKFWQKRDYELVAVHRNAIAQARRIKPQIPITGLNGIPIRDEIELEKHL